MASASAGPPVMWIRWQGQQSNRCGYAESLHETAHLTFWRWRCSCWLRALRARAAASLSALAAAGLALMERLADPPRCARGSDLALASELAEAKGASCTRQTAARADHAHICDPERDALMGE